MREIKISRINRRMLEIFWIVRKLTKKLNLVCRLTRAKTIPNSKWIAQLDLTIKTIREMTWWISVIKITIEICSVLVNSIWLEPKINKKLGKLCLLNLSNMRITALVESLRIRMRIGIGADLESLMLDNYIKLIILFKKYVFF